MHEKELLRKLGEETLYSAKGHFKPAQHCRKKDIVQQIFGGGCSDGSCPTIYETDRNSFVIQGYNLSAKDKEKISLPVGEDVIELPKEFLDAFKKT